jgi:hypothetical protein
VYVEVRNALLPLYLYIRIPLHTLHTSIPLHTHTSTSLHNSIPLHTHTYVEVCVCRGIEVCNALLPASLVVYIEYTYIHTYVRMYVIYIH